MNLARVSPVMLPGSKRLLQTASFSAAAATQIFPHQRSGRAEALRVAAPPRAVWKVPAAAAVDARPEAPSATQPSNADVSHFLLPQPTASKSAAAVQQQLQQPQQVGPAPPGDLRLVEFMEQVKQELWEFSAMPLRKRFRVQSLLRRLHTPPLETWSDALARATEECPRPFTRTLLARQDASSALSSVPAHCDDLEAPGFDLLLLCWRPGAASVIHDHPNAGCWVKVLKGEIKETRYSLAPDGGASGTSSSGVNRHGSGSSAVGASGGGGEVAREGRLRETSSITCKSGTVTYIEDSMGLHKMENPSPTEECISLHLYSPGISECTTWADPSACASNFVKSQMYLDDNFAKRTTSKKFGRL